MNMNIINKENILKKSISDLASSVIHKDDLSKELSGLSTSTSSSLLGSTWNPLSTTTSSSTTSSTIASIKEQPSLIPKNAKLKKTLSKKTTATATTRDKLKSLESAKIIKKREDDRKQKLRLNAERHKLYLKKKREEEEEKLANSQRQKEEEKRNKLEANKNKQKQMDMEALLIKKRNEKIKQNDKKRQLKTSKEVAKSILLNNPNLYGTSSVIASTLDKFKNSPILDTTVLLKKKNSSSQSSIMKKSKLSNGKKTSISSLLSGSSSSNNNSRISNSNKGSTTSNIIKKSAIPKAKSTLANKNRTTTTTLKSHSNTNSSIARSHPSSSSTSTTNNNTTTTTTPSTANISTQNILSELNHPPSKPIILGLNNLDDSNKLANTSIISISSSRSSTTPYKGTILQDGEFPDIPSDDSDEECNRSSLIATWAKTPNLLKELEKQQNINPDDIFGGYRPCHLDEIFKGSHFKRHTPNENWADSSILHDDIE